MQVNTLAPPSCSLPTSYLKWNYPAPLPFLVLSQSLQQKNNLNAALLSYAVLQKHKVNHSKYNLKLLLFILWQRPQVNSESKCNRCCTYFISIKYSNRETSPRLQGAKLGNCTRNTNKMHHRLIQVMITGAWLAAPLGSSLYY